MCYDESEFWDDGLTEAEMDLICGVYKLYSKSQICIINTLLLLIQNLLQSKEISLPTFLGGQNNQHSWRPVLTLGIGHQIVNHGFNLELKKYRRRPLVSKLHGHGLQL